MCYGLHEDKLDLGTTKSLTNLNNVFRGNSTKARTPCNGSGTMPKAAKRVVSAEDCHKIDRHAKLDKSTQCKEHKYSSCEECHREYATTHFHTNQQKPPTTRYHRDEIRYGKLFQAFPITRPKPP